MNNWTDPFFSCQHGYIIVLFQKSPLSDGAIANQDERVLSQWFVYHMPLASITTKFGQFAAFWCIALLTVLIQFASAQGQAVRAQPAGHMKMVELLKTIRDNTDEENFYQGDKPARHNRALVANRSSNRTLTQTIDAYFSLGYAELAIGNEDPAIDALTRAYKFLPSRPSARWPKELREKILLGLGIAYMRLAETENCCALNSADNCIIPIQGGGLHTEERGARGAIQYLNELFQTADPGSLMQLDAQWLLQYRAHDPRRISEVGSYGIPDSRVSLQIQGVLP